MKRKHYKVYTKIVSSYAWDTALCFINKTVSNYSNNSPQGIYGESNYKNTGLSTPVCNIYDMGGNLWDITSELYSVEGRNYVPRGGRYNGSATNDAARTRANSAGEAADIYTFRLTLYIE